MSSSQLSLSTDGSDLPESQSPCPFLVGPSCSHHARINCPGVTVQASCHLERGWACNCAGNECLVCVVFVVLLVASVLASMALGVVWF